MIEVEAKVRSSDKHIDSIRKLAGKIGKYRGKTKKIDDYYTLEDLREYPKKSLRVRKSNGYYVVNFKQSLSYEKGVHAKKEVEFKVSDLKGFFELIDDFGFKKWLRKEKVTELYEINKYFHIELNNVKNLGWFIEVEYLAKPGEVKSARKKVVSVLKNLGVSDKDIIKDGYTKMLWNEGFVEK